MEVDVAQFLPVQDESVGGDALRVREEDVEESALDGVEAHFSARLGGQEEGAPVRARDDWPEVSAL